MEEQITIGLSSELLEKFDALAQKIGVTVEQIWPWLVRQQYVDAIYYPILAIIFIAAFVVTLSFTIKHWNDKKPDICSIYRSDHGGFWVAAIIVFGVAMIAFTIGGIAEFPNIFNPEYHALRDLMGMIK